MSNNQRHIILCTTSDISTDRRMQRIADTLIEADYHIEWIGRDLQGLALQEKYHPSIVKCFFESGALFYAEFNMRLFFRLMGKAKKTSIINAVDLDTILAAKLVSKLKTAQLVFDAHEYFVEVPELNGKSFVKSVWRNIGKMTLKGSKWNYTVNTSLANIFADQHGQKFDVIRNTPPRNLDINNKRINNKRLAYVGVLNKGRGLETAIEAMQYLEGYELWMIGDGDIRKELEAMTRKFNLEDSVIFKGWTKPDELSGMLDQCSIGLNLLDDISESYRLSLANKCFDYIHMSLPAIHMKFPEYQQINERFEIGVLIESLDSQEFAEAVLSLESEERYKDILANCAAAAQIYNWDTESKKLLAFYQQLH